MLNSSPGNNSDFVKGMKLLQRREKIVKSLLKGQGTVGNDNPINSAYGNDFCNELSITPHDPDQAKHFLASLQKFHSLDKIRIVTWRRVEHQTKTHILT